MTTGAVPTRCLRFRRDLHVRRSGDSVYLFDERGVTSLRGAAVGALAELLEHPRDLAAIVAARPLGLTADQVLGLVEQLVGAGLVVEVRPVAADGGHDPAEAWWDAAGSWDGARAPAPPAGTAGRGGVVLTALQGVVDGSAVTGALAAAGLTVGSGASEGAPGLRVVLCADYLDPALARVDAESRRDGTPWLIAKLSGVALWIGPVFRPGGGACWHCLAHRLGTHRRSESILGRTLGMTGPAPRPLVGLRSGTVAGAHLVAMEAEKWLGGLRHAGQDAVWVLDSSRLSGESHPLRARPQCPACGDPGIIRERAQLPVELRPAPRVGCGGGDRTLPADEMLARHSHLVSPITGVIKQIARDPAAPAFAHAFRSGVNLSRTVSGVAALRSSLRAENGGKGLSALDAEVGALCEAAERHSGTWQGDEATETATFRELGAAAVDPRSCLLYDDRQYAGRAGWNPRHSPFNHVPQVFAEDRPLDWTPLWSITHHRRRLLPTALLYYGAPHDGALLADSNGCAAGSSREDAVLQGLLELVERDAVALWWYNRSRVPGVDIGAFSDVRLVEQQRRHADLGRQLWALDVSADLGVPVVVAVSRRPGEVGGERVLLGFGAHPDPEVALRRAVSEVNQMLSADAVDPEAAGDPDWAAWSRQTVADAPYLLPDPDLPATGPATHAHRPCDDIADEVRAIAARVADAGMEVLVLDQTRPDVGIPVVKVVVPGLRSFWARFAPGRLFDVPVALGRRATATPYDELNPLPLFM